MQRFLYHCHTRNVLTFVNTTIIAYHQNHQALADFLPVCNSRCAVFTNPGNWRVGGVPAAYRKNSNKRQPTYKRYSSSLRGWDSAGGLDGWGYVEVLGQADRIHLQQRAVYRLVKFANRPPSRCHVLTIYLQEFRIIEDWVHSLHPLSEETCLLRHHRLVLSPKY